MTAKQKVTNRILDLHLKNMQRIGGNIVPKKVILGKSEYKSACPLNETSLMGIEVVKSHKESYLALEYT